MKRAWKKSCKYQMLMKDLQTFHEWSNMKNILITDQNFWELWWIPSLFSSKFEYQKVHENIIIQNGKPRGLKNDIFDQQSRGLFQSSAFGSCCPEVFYKEVALNNFEKFTGKNLRRSPFSNKVASLTL